MFQMLANKFNSISELKDCCSIILNKSFIQKPTLEFFISGKNPSPEDYMGIGIPWVHNQTNHGIYACTFNLSSKK